MNNLLKTALASITIISSFLLYKMYEKNKLQKQEADAQKQEADAKINTMESEGASAVKKAIKATEMANYRKQMQIGINKKISKTKVDSTNSALEMGTSSMTGFLN